MKFHLLLLLLIWALTDANDIIAEETASGVRLTCKDGKFSDLDGGNATLDLLYRDDNSKEYVCHKNNIDHKIYVKFRTCDNCVELDIVSIVGIVVGNLVATIGMGVAVYFVASQTATGQAAPKKQRSDKQQLVEDRGENYEPLRPRRQDVYDRINH